MSHSSFAPANLPLSAAELELLKEIEAAGTPRRFQQVADVAVVGAFPAFVFGMLHYMQYLAAHGDLALCRLYGTFYIPENGLLEKSLTVPMVIIAFLVSVMTHYMVRRQRQLRLMRKLLQRTAKPSSVS